MVDTRVQARSLRNRKRRSRTTFWVVLTVFSLLLFAALWIGIRGALAKSALDEAVPAATSLVEEIANGDRGAASASLTRLNDRAAEAARLTSDPVWRAGEWLPFVGANLHAVREAAGIIDDVSRNVVKPIVDVTASIGIDEFAPIDGAVQLQPLIDAQPRISAASDALRSANARAQSIGTEDLLAVVSDAIKKLKSTVAEAAVAIDTVDRAATLLPPMMGADGERNYVLLFQNPAELRATGGIPGALAQLTVVNGAISLTRQASSADFPRAPAPVLDLPLDTRALYGDKTGRYIQSINLTPQFPISATLAAEMWRQQFGVEVDGVMSVDPVVLSYLLRATGPIALPTGDVLTSDNAVQLLLSDVYARYPDPRQQDLFFAGAASAVFSAVASGSLKPEPLVDALMQAGNEHRLLLWSDHTDEQKILAETTIAGGLPISDSSTDRFGVYLNDATGSKMGTYLRTEVSTGQAVCRADGLPQQDVQITLTNTAPLDAASSLPVYVTGEGAYGVTPGNIKLVIVIYGPPGSSNLGVNRDGVEFPHHPTTDSGYPVSSVGIELAPGESTTFTSSFLARTAQHKEIVIQKTPEINIIPVREVEISC